MSSGSIVLYTDSDTSDEGYLNNAADSEVAATTEYTDTIGTDVVQNRFTEGEAPISNYAKESGFTPSTNEVVNKTDGRLDEQQDKFGGKLWT